MSTIITHGSWGLDPVHTKISMSIRHAGILKVEASFEEAESTLVINENNTADLEAMVKADSFNSQSADRDAHVKGPDFLDTEKYPTLSFKANDVRVDNIEQFVITGDLTIKGTTLPVVFDVEFGGQAVDPFGMTRAGFRATAAISRREFGLTWNSVLETGGVLVGDRVGIEVNAAFILQ